MSVRTRVHHDDVFECILRNDARDSAISEKCVARLTEDPLRNADLGIDVENSCYRLLMLRAIALALRVLMLRAAALALRA